jgi:hypothetical protein
MNGVQEDVNADKSKTLMHTAIYNNGRKVSRGGPPNPLPMQAGQPQTPAQAAMALKQQQQQSVSGTFTAS